MFKRKKTKKKSTEKLQLALDIGTEFIKTVVFRKRNGEIEVLGYDRAPQKQNAMRGALIINLENVIDVVDVSLGNVMHMAEEITGEDLDLPEQVILGIAGELVKGVVIHVNVDREQPEESISEEELSSLLKNVRKEAFPNAKDEIADDTGIHTDQIVEIDTVINSTYIDGVKVDSPLGFKGSSIEFKVFSTFAPKIHVDSVKEVARSLNLNILGVVVEPYALALALDNARSERFSGIFIDIGGGTTDVALVKNGAIVGTKMFAYGGRVFTKRIEIEFNLDYIAAERLKLDYSDQKLSEKETARVKKAIMKDIPVWLDGVELALAEFEDITDYPPQIYLCGGGTLLPDIHSSLIAHPWLQVLPFTKFPKVSYLFPNQIHGVNDITRKATHSIDVTPMALARMGLDIIKNDKA